MKRIISLVILTMFSTQVFAGSIFGQASLSEVWYLSGFLGALFFFAARYRVSLAIVMTALSIVYLSGSLGIWGEDKIAKSHSYFYLISYTLASSLLLIGSLLGAWLSWRAFKIDKLNQANQTMESDDFD